MIYTVTARDVCYLRHTGGRCSAPRGAESGHLSAVLSAVHSAVRRGRPSAGPGPGRDRAPPRRGNAAGPDGRVPAPERLHAFPEGNSSGGAGTRPGSVFGGRFEHEHGNRPLRLLLV